MRVVTLAVAGLSALGCGGASNGGGSVSGDPGGGMTTLHPPANIDLVLCASVADASDPASTDACQGCCTKGGFSESTFYASKCVCGKPLGNDGVTVCQAENATDAACSACCTSASYTGYTWIGGTGSTCSCFGRTDDTSCAVALSEPNPDSACRDCCLNHGYIGEVYIGIDTPECGCLDG